MVLDNDEDDVEEVGQPCDHVVLEAPESDGAFAFELLQSGDHSEAPDVEVVFDHEAYTLQELYGEPGQQGKVSITCLPKLSVKGSARTKGRQAGVVPAPELREFDPPLCYNCMTLQLEQEVRIRGCIFGVHVST